MTVNEDYQKVNFLKPRISNLNVFRRRERACRIVSGNFGRAGLFVDGRRRMAGLLHEYGRRDPSG